MARKGPPAGNQNARKHGFYSRALTEAEQLEVQQLMDLEGIDDEIAILRWKLRQLIENSPDRIDLHLQAANVIARLVRTRYQISRQEKKTLKEAIQKVLTDVAAPLGVGIAVGAKLSR
ncbi:MAG: hypothetical protein ACLFVD_02735 [Dehalococcoidia bacterium]